MGFWSRLTAALRPTSPPAATPATPPPAQTAPVTNPDWYIAHTRVPNRPEHVVSRCRYAKPARADLATLTSAIVIKWTYTGRADGMPEPAEQARQRAFEDAIDPLTGSGPSELVHVTTGCGMKEWVFYARSREAFMEQFNTLLASQPRYPLKIEFYDDPEWKVWEDLIAPIVAKTGK